MYSRVTGLNRSDPECGGYMVLSSFTFEGDSLTCKKRMLMLILVWFGSITGGMVLSYKSDGVSAALMQSAFFSHTSILQMLFSTLLPLAVSAFCVYKQVFFPLCLLCSVEGVALGYCLMGLLLAFTSAGWLLSVILLFPVLISQLLLFWFYFRFCSLKHSSFRKDFCVCITFSLFAFILYTLSFLPFINSLLYSLHEEGIVYSCWI